MESQHGLSYARNRGWLEAQGEYVGYVDDDCKVPTQWLSMAKEIIDQIAPAIFGGPSYPFYNSPKPCWWKDNYGTLEHSEEARSLHQSEFLIGCNIFVRRSVLKDMCGFDNTLGMYDQNLGYGEESELQTRMRSTMTDEIIYYDPRLFVYHLVRPKQMTWFWILNSRFVGGRYSYYVINDNNPKSARPSKLKLLAQAILILLRLPIDIIVGILRLDREQYPYLQNYLYENTLKYVRDLGVIYEKLWFTKDLNRL
jgi:glycosyltransferase involved in cell wall biosynthesis